MACRRAACSPVPGSDDEITVESRGADDPGFADSVGRCTNAPSRRRHEHRAVSDRHGYHPRLRENTGCFCLCLSCIEQAIERPIHTGSGLLQPDHDGKLAWPKFDKPLTRVKETTQLVKQMLAGENRFRWKNCTK